jgi:dTDP-D-glucose 4,6-dehydratase
MACWVTGKTGAYYIGDGCLHPVHAAHTRRPACLDADDAPAAYRFHDVSTDEVYGSLAADDPAFRDQGPRPELALRGQ